VHTDHVHQISVERSDGHPVTISGFVSNQPRSPGIMFSASVLGGRIINSPEYDVPHRHELGCP
jgi:hypothetical protein